MFEPREEFGVAVLADGRVRTTERVVWTGSRGDQVEVLAGTTSDGATRPWFTGALVDQWGPATRAFLVHDVLCEALRTYREDRAAWFDQVTEHHLPPNEPERPAFSSVDADGALRLMLAELGTPLVLRWFYWTGVRWGALGSRYRWAGWWRTLPLLLVWTLPVLVVMAAPVLGATVGRLLLAVCELLALPVGRSRPRIRRRQRARLEVTPDRTREREAAARVEAAAASLAAGMLSLPKMVKLVGEPGPEYVIPRGPLGPSQPVVVQEVHDGRLVVLRWHPDRGHWERLDVAARPDPGPCPPGTHSNTGSAADAEIAACPRCNPNAKPVDATTPDKEWRTWIGTEPYGTTERAEARARRVKIARTAARWISYPLRGAARLGGRVLDAVVDALVDIR